MRIAIASQQGGTGKITTSISLAAGLGKRNSKVMLIDTDSQANSSKLLLPRYQQIPIEQTLHATILRRQPSVVHQTQMPGLAIVPSRVLLSDTDIEMTIAGDHQERSREHLLWDSPKLLGGAHRKQRTLWSRGSFIS
jgi:chromosome partitioning protein